MSMLSALVDLWLKQIEAARKAKTRDFDRHAKACTEFYLKRYEDINVISESRTDDLPTAVQKLRLAKAREFVSLMVPFVFNKVPNRLVNPSKQRLSMELAAAIPEAAQWREQVLQRDAIGAEVMQEVLNYLPGEYGLTREARIALPEAFVTGRALTWTELVEAPAGLIPASCAESIENVLIDPDCVQWRDGAYLIRKRRRSAYRIAEDFAPFGITVKMLRAQHTSAWAEAIKQQNDDPNYRQDDTAGDIVTYYEIYSRIGLGTILRDSPKEVEPLSQAVESLGGHCWIAICPGLQHPLNLTPGMLDRVATDSSAIEEIKAALSWPIAFYEDFSNPWPCQHLDFLPNDSDPWATSPLWGALPLLTFMDRAYNFLFQRMRQTSRDILVCSQGMEDELYRALVSDLDQRVVKVPGKPGEDIAKLYSVLTLPPLKPEIFSVIRMAEQQFERYTGMTALLSGAEDARQVRVAADIQAREAHATTRPQDYADAVEEWMGRQSRAEAIAARLTMTPTVVAKMVREPSSDTPGVMPEGGWGPLTMTWMDVLATDDPVVACSELEYTIESGSGRRKNQAKFLADATQLSQTLLAPMLQMAQEGGNPGPYNALMKLLGEGLDRDMQDFMIAPQQQPSPEQQQAKQQQQAEAAQKQQEMEMQGAQRQQEMAMQGQQKEQEMGMQAAQAQQDMAVQAARHQQDMQHREQKHQQDVRAKKTQVAKRAKGKRP